LAGLDSLTGVTGLDVVANIIVHAGPIEETMDGFVSSFYPLVSCNGSVMVIMEDLCAKGPSGDAESIVIIDKQVIRVQ